MSITYSYVYDIHSKFILIINSRELRLVVPSYVVSWCAKCMPWAFHSFRTYDLYDPYVHSMLLKTIKVISKNYLLIEYYSTLCMRVFVLHAFSLEAVLVD